MLKQRRVRLIVSGSKIQPGRHQVAFKQASLLWDDSIDLKQSSAKRMPALSSRFRASSLEFNTFRNLGIRLE